MSGGKSIYELYLDKYNMVCLIRYDNSIWSNLVYGKNSPCRYARSMARSFLWFKKIPCKLPHTHNGKADFPHPLVIIGPHLLRPMLGVVAHAQIKFLSRNGFVHGSLRHLIVWYDN